MEFKIVQKPSKKHNLYIIDNVDQLRQIEDINEQERSFSENAFKGEQNAVSINQYNRYVFINYIKPKKTDALTAEACRKTGAELTGFLNRQKLDEVTIINLSTRANASYLYAEGMALANYQFLKYRGEAKKLTNTLKTLSFTRQSITVNELNQLQVITDAVYRARTLVNEPLNYLTATQLSKEITLLGKEAGFKVTVLQKAQIEAEKMGGLLAVNRGSILPPTFTAMEYKPKKAINKKPIVLVGKGVVYDTGGLSLKPTPASMDRMKSDMSGAALVTAAMFSISKLQLPLHVIALVPATDNRPGENAYVPGDVITMYSGTTVEVLNTDAEGRLLLGDALHWAKRYNPELVLDFATLTGAASVAVGEHGIVCMGTADDNVKQAFRGSGDRQHERLVEYPLWDEYGDMIKSDIADLKNVGGPSGGAITAGKFLEHFTAYPWMHFDIAGVSFSMSKRNYITTGGTAYGMRMLMDFLMNYGKA
ncbi:MAG: leucyl aminopeptidase [Sphingobacteriales bacterium]|nr:MAG: leucyl aminopeptidase [Sphingobacteriales bacterium]